MKLSVAIAKKLLQLANGEPLSRSELNTLADELVSEGILLERITGRTKRSLFISDRQALDNWLFNRHGINNLEEYINATPASRAENVMLTGNSKHSTVRTFKGFLVNSCQPVDCRLNNQLFTVHSAPGTWLFISEYETFYPPADTTIVGIENAEVFSRIHKLQHLFPGNTLFVCRYPQNQSKDLIAWLQLIPNPYLHFGDYDFAGFNIFIQEYKKHLGGRASFFVPANIEALLQQHGNSALYDRQNLNKPALADAALQPLITLLHKHRKGLEQEVLLVG